MAGRHAILTIVGAVTLSARALAMDDPAAIPGLLPDACAATATDQIRQADPAAAIVFPLGENEDPFELLMTAARTRAEGTGQTPDTAALEILRSTIGEVIVEEDARILLSLLHRLWQRGETRAAMEFGNLLAQWPTLGDIQPSADDAFTAASVALGAEGVVALARYRRTQAGPTADAAALEAQARALLWARVASGDCAALVDLAWIDLEPVQGDPRVQQARMLLQLAAARRIEPAAIALATLHLEPAWNVFDPSEAVRVLEAAAAWGSDAVRLRLAALRLKGPLPVRDRVAGIQTLRIIPTGSPYAADVALLLAEDASGRFGGPFEPEMVAGYLEQAEANLDRRVEPWLALARAYREGWSGTVAPASAERLYQILADQGNPAGLLGVAQLRLLRVGPNEASVRLVRQAAEMGSLEAIQQLIGLAAAGSAPPSDLHHARALLELATRSGSASAALAISRILLGESILHDEIGLRDQAIAALQGAVRAGSVEATLDLARAYETGLAGVVDVPLSRHLYETALVADSGDTDAMLEIGRAYLGTTGLGPRLGSAAEWFRRCTIFGDTRCFAELGKMGRSPEGARYLEPGEAESALTAGATSGHSQSMFELAQMLAEQGQVEEARYWLERSAERGHTGAMLAMVSALRDDPASLDAAVHWFELARAHATTDIASLLNIGRAYRSGAHLPRDLGLALSWFERAARLGSPVAMREVGLWYLQQPELATRGPAETWLSHAVTLGDIEAMEHLAEAYRLGLLGEPRPADAYRLALLAAHRGSVRAKIWTAEFLIEGYGTSGDPARAMAWLREAGVAGDAAAMSRLGQMLLAAASSHRADEALADEGMDWLRSAADAGDRQALFALGRMYEAGRFVARDANLAAAFYEAAAAAGHLEAIVAGSALVGEAEATE